jgi:ferredoxin-NADP reductase
MDEPRMAALLVSHHRPGFYLRVLEEGEAGAVDEIIKVADGPEHVTVAEINALLYLPGHPREQLERSLRISALSPGWKTSLQALVDQTKQEASATASKGNAGLTAAGGPPPAWPGFRPLRVARVTPETDSVTSLSFENPDGSPLPLAEPGQFLVLKLRPKPDRPPILRNYSLSGMPDCGIYRVSIKREVNGAGSTFLHTQVRVGDVLEASAPRGTFTLAGETRPVVLLSAGIGATPVLAMLHFLTSSNTSPEVWWLYGAHNRAEHPFANESRELLKELPHGRSYILYSKPSPEDRLGEDYDAAGHLNVAVFDRLGVPQNADFYLCGPASFLSDLTPALKTWGVAANQIRTEIFGPAGSLTPGIARASNVPAHPPAGNPGSGPQVSFARSGLTVRWGPGFQSLLELAEACDVPVKWSCRTGVCHNCESGLIGGAVGYQPDPLEPPGEGNVLICCSQPREDVELDL